MRGSADDPLSGRAAVRVAWLTVVLAALNTGPLFAKSFAEPFLNRPDEWFRSVEGLRVAANILSWQSPEGSWPKNQSTTDKPYEGDPKALQGTFDNSATTGELRFLARAYRVTRDPRCEQAFRRGLAHILKAQYPTGGWPQFYPPSRQYHRHITFNDDSMVRLLEFLREVATAAAYEFLPEHLRNDAEAAFDRGIQCILKCQITVNGKLTVWCAQHDELNYQPRGGRTYELPSLSGSESAGILRLLMTLDHPSPEVVRAITAGVEWFRSAKLSGFRIEKVNGERTLVRDPSAPPLWARFYDLENGSPIFSDRDGIKKYDYMQIGRERRNGYAWYGSWGMEVEQAFAKWSEKALRLPATGAPG